MLRLVSITGKLLKPFGNAHMNRTEELLAKCRLGDASGYTGLYTDHCKAVYNAVLRLIGNTAEAEDIVQESFVVAFERIEQFKMTGGFRPWVKRIAINKSVDLIRKRRISLVELEPDWMTGPEETIVDEEFFTGEMDKIAAAIDALPANYRTVFNLFAVENIPHAEIAQMLGLEHTTVRTQYHRARQKIVATLQKKQDHES